MLNPLVALDYMLFRYHIWRNKMAGAASSSIGNEVDLWLSLTPDVDGVYSSERHSECIGEVSRLLRKGNKMLRKRERHLSKATLLFDRIEKKM